MVKTEVVKNGNSLRVLVWNINEEKPRISLNTQKMEYEFNSSLISSIDITKKQFDKLMSE